MRTFLNVSITEIPFYFFVYKCLICIRFSLKLVSPFSFILPFMLHLFNLVNAVYYLHFWLNANFISLCIAQVQNQSSWIRFCRFGHFHPLLIASMTKLSACKHCFKISRTESNLTKRFTAESRSEICCAHLMHWAEQSAWLKVGKLSINTNTYHSIICCNSCCTREENER